MATKNGNLPKKKPETTSNSPQIPQVRILSSDTHATCLDFPWACNPCRLFFIAKSPFLESPTLSCQIFTKYFQLKVQHLTLLNCVYYRGKNIRSTAAGLCRESPNCCIFRTLGQRERIFMKKQFTTLLTLSTAAACMLTCTPITTSAEESLDDLQIF